MEGEVVSLSARLLAVMEGEVVSLSTGLLPAMPGKVSVAEVLTAAGSWGMTLFKDVVSEVEMFIVAGAAGGMYVGEIGKLEVVLSLHSGDVFLTLKFVAGSFSGTPS